MSKPHDQSPVEVKARMIALHHELSNFLFYLTMNNGTIPPSAPEDEADAITLLQERLEREVRRMQDVIARRNLDTMVEQSLKAAGFEPDKPEEPTPSDSI